MVARLVSPEHLLRHLISGKIDGMHRSANTNLIKFAELLRKCQLAHIEE